MLPFITTQVHLASVHDEGIEGEVEDPAVTAIKTLAHRRALRTGKIMHTEGHQGIE